MGAASELKASHWKFLMGAVGSQSMYIRQLALIMKKLRGGVTLDALRQGVRDSGLSEYLKELALLRLRFAEEYIDDAHRLTDVLRPGRLVIVDLRDELIEKDEALGLFVVLLQMFAETTYRGRRFNKLSSSTKPTSTSTARTSSRDWSRWCARCATRVRASWWRRRIPRPHRRH